MSQGRSIDVIEIDGASNNGVDAIRELRDTVGYMPSSGKYKVYIIDEVHMLSTSAFNALLKTLEEPPEHVVFIMATTEVHKIPQTILSRCQRFDFRRISTRQITEQLKMICEADGVQAEEEALWVIARQGDGSMRDSQSLLDQVITFANGPLKRATVVEILGLTDHALLYATLSALAQREPTQILPILSKVALAGYEPSLFAQDLMENLRHLLFVKIGQDQAVRMVELPDSELRTLQEIAATLTEEEIHFLFDMAVKGAGDIMRSSEPRIVLEMVLLRMAAAPRLQDLASLLNGAASVHPGQVSVPKPPLAQAVRAAHPNTTQPAPGSRPASRAGLELSPQERWFEFVQKIRGLDAFLAAKLEPLIFTGVKDKTVELVIPPKAAFLKDQLMDAETQKKIKSLIDQHWAAGYAVNVQMGSGGTEGTSAQALAQDKAKKKEQDLAAQISEHPKVKTAAAVFKGQIKTIKESGSKNGGTSR